MPKPKREEAVVREAAPAYAALDPHDVTLIEQKLRLTVEQRIEELVTAVNFIADLRKEVAKSRG